jgi:hypothetical protein
MIAAGAVFTVFAVFFNRVKALVFGFRVRN